MGREDEQGAPPLEEIVDEEILATFAHSVFSAETRRYQIAIEAIKIGIFEYFPQIDHIEANEVWYRLAGVDRGKGLRYAIDRVSPEDLRAIRHAFNIGNREGPHTLVFRYRHPSLGERWLRVSGRYMTLDDCPANPWRFVGVLTDITDNKRAEEALRENETLQETVMAHLPVGLILIDRKTGIVELANQNAASLFGISAGAMIGKHRRDFLGEWPAEIPNAGGTERDVGERIEKRIRRADGSEVWILASVIDVMDGGRTKILECLVDITQRKRAEEAYQSAIHRLRLATRAGGVGVWEFDIESGTEIWDDQMYRLYGATREEFPDGNAAWRKRVHPDDLAAQEAEFEKAAQCGTEYDSQFRVVLPDGRTRIIRSLATVQCDEAGKPKALVGTNWDITKEKDAEAELIRQNKSLEEAGIRATELMLRAEVANEAKSIFLATMSHEIRTPLNGIIGMAALLLDGPLSGDQRQYAELLKSSGESLLVLINQILDYSKLESQKLALELVDFSPAAAVGEAVESIRAEAARKGLALETAVGDTVPARLRGDPVRLRQILSNLLGNAVKFTERGGITGSVEDAGPCPGGIALRFSVADTGIGIPEEKQRELFAPFTQLDGSTTRRFGGTGLGLAIARRLAALMGGETGVISAENRGATFWFTAQFARAAGDEETRADAAGDPLPRLRRPGARILLAEDNQTNRIVALKILERLGARPEAVAGGIEAVAAFAATRPDLVLMDCEMADVDGYEATRRIRDMERASDGTTDTAKARSAAKRRRVPVIALTAHAFPGDRDRCIAAGMDDYLSKPYTPEILAAMLNRWLPASGERDIFDREAFLERAMGDVRLAAEILRTFLEDIPREITELDRAIDLRDARAASLIAHRIKGAALNMACARIAARANEVGGSATFTDGKEARGRACDLRAAFEEAAALLREELAAMEEHQ